jgi:hypothetical protein
MVVPANRSRTLDLERLRYCLVSPRAPARNVLGAGYRCWKDVWTRTLQELDGADSIRSDDFTRQDELGLLFEGSDCIGMTAYRWVDFASPAARDDSYFSAWPDEAKDALVENGTRVCIGSYLTVAPEWRRTENHSAKELLLGLAVRRFLASPADVMTGTMRNDRGMSGIAYRLGARLLAPSTMHGVDVDLVAFDRCALEDDGGLSRLDPSIRTLWRGRKEGDFQ